MNFKEDRILPKESIKKKDFNRSVSEFNRWYKGVVKLCYSNSKIRKKNSNKLKGVSNTTLLLENIELIKKRFDKAVNNYELGIMTESDYNVILNSVSIYRSNGIG